MKIYYYQMSLRFISSTFSYSHFSTSISAISQGLHTLLLFSEVRPATAAWHNLATTAVVLEEAGLSCTEDRSFWRGWWGRIRQIPQWLLRRDRVDIGGLWVLVWSCRRVCILLLQACRLIACIPSASSEASPSSLWSKWQLRRPKQLRFVLHPS